MKRKFNFKKALRKFLIERVYLWDLVWTNPDDPEDWCIVTRFVEGTNVREYRNSDTQKQVNIIDNINGRSQLIEINVEMQNKSGYYAFRLARYLCATAKHKFLKIKIRYRLKELREFYKQ